MKTLIIILVLLQGLIFKVHSQEKNPEEILSAVREKLGSVRDFSADVEIDINIDFIKIPNKYATVIYKHPDKFKFRSPGFFMIPKKGFGFSIVDLLEKSYTAVYVGLVEQKGKVLEEIKIIPMENKSDIVLASFWIDTESDLVYHFEAVTKKSGYYLTDFEYSENDPLPSKNIIRFEVDDIRLPLRFMGKVDMKQFELQEVKMGEVIITYYNYDINPGLKDEEFEDDSDEITFQNEG